jgi:hypothetical protein
LSPAQGIPKSKAKVLLLLRISHHIFIRGQEVTSLSGLMEGTVSIRSSFCKELTIYLFIYLVGLGFELKGKAGALPLELHLQSILLWLFWRWGIWNCFPRLALNFDSPNFNLSTSWEYGPMSPVLFCFFAILGFELRAYTLSHCTSPFL